jgi:hypothetical protein
MVLETRALGVKVLFVAEARVVEVQSSCLMNRLCGPCLYLALQAPRFRGRLARRLV